jgi:branched-chain amino acid transport system ATP-binding protein
MALLEVRGITVRYGGIIALGGVDLDVDEDAAVALIGPNGAGKTTLFDCINGIRHPDRGRILFAGRRIDTLPIFRRARLGIGRTFQRIELFGGLTAREHLIVAERAHRGDGSLWRDLANRGQPSHEEMDRVAELIGELGLDEVADAPIESLSLGHGRLVELGRALIAEPRLLLLDEPSSGLDSLETATLAEMLRGVRARREMAILLVEHDLELVKALAEQVTVLDFGLVIAAGPMDDVMANAAVRRAYLGEAV